MNAKSIPDYHDFPYGMTDPVGVRTKFSHPYSYDPIVQYRKEGVVATTTYYTDRLHMWDSKLLETLSKKHFKNAGQYWDHRTPEAIEAFLRDWTGDQELELVMVQEECNVSSGYPLWRLDFKNSAKIPQT